MDLGTHSGFIVASYAICFVVVVGLILWVLIDKAQQEAALAELAKRGISRAGATGTQASTSGTDAV